MVAALAVLTAASADVVALGLSALRPELDKDGVGELVVVRVVEVGDESLAFLAKPRRRQHLFLRSPAAVLAYPLAIKIED